MNGNGAFIGANGMFQDPGADTNNAVGIQWGSAGPFDYIDGANKPGAFAEGHSPRGSAVGSPIPL